jgi:hypothetical protein
MTIRLKLITALQDAADTLEAAGIDVSPAWKRRDPREPARREKEAAEDALMLWIRRHFNRQAKRIRARLELQPPAQKALPAGFDDEFELDDDDMAELIRLLTKQAQSGVALFGAGVALPINYTMTNLEAAEWARKYAYTLVKDIDATTVDVLRKAITAFVETPGFTIGDLMDLLPFDEERALRVAVTEVTRAYAQGQVIAGEQMRDEFPDVPVKKRWFTNNDYTDGKTGLCDLCAPLDGVEVDLAENFYDPAGDEYLDGNPPYHPNCRCWVESYTALAEL